MSVLLHLFWPWMNFHFAGRLRVSICCAVVGSLSLEERLAIDGMSPAPGYREP